MDLFDCPLYRQPRVHSSALEITTRTRKDPNFIASTWEQVLGR